MPIRNFEAIARRAVHKLQNPLMKRVRSEYTVMPRFGFHQPLDYDELTLPYRFERREVDAATGLAVPTGKDRFGYSPDDTTKYLDWGRYDHDELLSVLKRHDGYRTNAKILDFGCSSGRVLRHFNLEHEQEGWQLNGCDLQAIAIQWIREFLPRQFAVITTSTIPHLPYEDNTFDFIYGFSVFTHIKYQWDAWLMELRRVLKPGGIMVQSIHCENAWRFYYENSHEDWVRENHTPRVFGCPRMDVDYLYYGDISVSQVFWRREIAHEYWQRYLNVLEILDPPKYSFQDWIVCQKT